MNFEDILATLAPGLLTGAGFSFRYGYVEGREWLPANGPTHRTEKLPAGATLTTRWCDASTGLEITRHATWYRDSGALDWWLELANQGSADTPIVSDLRALDLIYVAPRAAPPAYELHHLNGAPSNPTDFEPRVTALQRGETTTLAAGGGRSSNRDFPFCTLVDGAGALVVAIGWSGQWQAKFTRPDDRMLRITAGLEHTRFRLRPGETVRSPRILLYRDPRGCDAAHAGFRELIYAHYAARRDGQPLLPVAYCNTCFTRGGGWLNECNAQNQISLINAYADLGVTALWTDAGWFEGGWPDGVGSWTPRHDAYPEGMGPVAAAAAARGMSYGLWFEPERVAAGSKLHRDHPEWLLTAPGLSPAQNLADFGRPEVQDYYFKIVREFMALPGFRVYRQDFNIDPLPFWRASDGPDRRGITEMKYVAGLYSFWDRIAATWPDSLREECASGGRRIDLETIRRMHIHQKSDYWFDDEVDQASLGALSRYLPNSTLMAPLCRLDDYSFHSTLPGSLCLGWIADAPDFDAARARQLLARYAAVRPLLVGQWYPLTPCERGTDGWLASQYHRADLGQGMVLAFRRKDCTAAALTVRLQGLDPVREYTLRCDTTGRTLRARGAALAAGWTIELPTPRSSALFLYQ
jgi:alpha-galactosidase